MKVCHLTSVHPRSDVRIFKKECLSLKEAGYDVSLIVADDLPDEEQGGIKVRSVGKESSRLIRMLISGLRIYRTAVRLDADIYHFHDPELIPVGILLKIKKKSVICDVHEDVPGDILNKPYLPAILKNIVAKSIRLIQFLTYRFFDFVVTATPTIKNKLIHYNPRTMDINNYPIPEEFRPQTEWRNRKREICYIGLITRERGISEVVDAIGISSVSLNLAGTVYPDELYQELKRKKAWEKVIFFGQVARNEVAEILNSSWIGIVTFHPGPNHGDAQPNKMFEYMAAGIPVIASDFPLWQEFIEQNGCGICVDPRDSGQIAHAINQLLNDEKRAEQMGQNGYRAIKEKYNWNNESIKLMDIYKTIAEKHHD